MQSYIYSTQNYMIISYYLLDHNIVVVDSAPVEKHVNKPELLHAGRLLYFTCNHTAVISQGENDKYCCVMLTKWLNKCAESMEMLPDAIIHVETL